MSVDTLVKQDSTAGEAYVIACLVQSDWERALKLMAEFGPSSAYAPHLAAIATRLLAEQRPAAAIDVAERAAALDPACAAALSILGRSLLAEQSVPIGGIDMPRAEAAVTALRRAAELDGRELAARVALADWHIRNGDAPEASLLVHQAMEIDSVGESAREVLKRLRKAVEGALKSLDREPDSHGSADRATLLSLAEDLRRRAAQLHQTQPLAAPASVSLCLIARDEARNLPRVIESVRGLATEIIVVDTGSSDDTVKIAQRLKARIGHFPWQDDFSAARNHSLSLASGEWILVLDADDELARESLPALKQWLSRAPEAAVVGLYRRYPSPSMQRDSVSVQPRLFRNGRGLHFEGAIHERLVTRDGRLAEPDIILTATIYHHGAIDGPSATARRRERNGRILTRVLEREPDDLRSRFYLGLTHFEGERWSDAVPALQAVVRDGGDELDFMPKAFACLGGALLNAHRPHEAETTLREGLARFPHHPELWFCLGLVCDHLGRLDEAIAANEAALQGRFGTSLNWHDWACREAKPHLALCDLKLTLGDTAAAAGHLAAAERFTGPEPAYGQIREAIGRTEAERDRLAAEREQSLMEQRARFADGDPAAGCQVVALLLASGQMDAARALVDGWLSQSPSEAWALIASGRAHLASGAVEAALRCFSAARHAQPELLDAWLGEAAAQGALNHWDEAECALLSAARRAPDHVEVDLALGEHYLARERWQEATHAFQRCLDRQDDHGGAWLGIGQSLLRSGNLSAAINCLQRAASLSDGGAAVRLALGEARDHLARQAAARPGAEQAVMTD
jgi:tetratricopeptide (TPR) repeat protein